MRMAYLEVVFMIDSDSEDNAPNPDSETEMLFREGEAEEGLGPSTQNKASTSTAAAASSKAPAKKCSKNRALKKAEKKSICYVQRIRGISTVLIWQKISCRLSETILSGLEPESGEEDGEASKPSEYFTTLT